MAKTSKTVKNTPEWTDGVVETVETETAETPLSFDERVDYANSVDSLMTVLQDVKTAKDSALATIAELQAAGGKAMEKIQTIQSAQFNSFAQEFGAQRVNRAGSNPTGRTRTPAANIAIGASRMVTNAHLAGKTRDEALQLALSRANELAAGYGLAEVPAETVALINAKIAATF